MSRQINAQGIGFSQKAGALIITQPITDPARYGDPLPTTIDNMGLVARWGKNNLLPQEMACDIEKTPMLSSTIDLKARIAVGSGPMLARVASIDKDGQEVLEYVNDNEISDWLEMNNAFDYSIASAKDAGGLGNPFTQLLLSRDRSYLAGFKRVDPTECRFSVKDVNTLKSEKVYLSGDWKYYNIPDDNINAKKDAKQFIAKHTATIPLLDKAFPLYDLQQRKTGVDFMLSMQYSMWNRHYYAAAPWYCSKPYVDISQGIPSMKDSMFQNQMQIKYVVEVHPLFWEHYDPKYKQGDVNYKKEVQEKFYADVEEYLVGGKNAYKSFWSVKLLDPNTQQYVSGVTITPVDDKLKDGKLLPDSADANSHILFALQMNPALVGLSIPGAGSAVTAGSGSNIREAYLVQVILMEAERRMINKVFTIAKHYNNWDKNLVIRYPNKVLTTLNTGANTQTIS